jgi:hypothetical protein
VKQKGKFCGWLAI